MYDKPTPLFKSCFKVKTLRKKSVKWNELHVLIDSDGILHLGTILHIIQYETKKPLTTDSCSKYKVVKALPFSRVSGRKTVSVVVDMDWTEPEENYFPAESRKSMDVQTQTFEVEFPSFTGIFGEILEPFEEVSRLSTSIRSFRSSPRFRLLTFSHKSSQPLLNLALSVDNSIKLKQYSAHVESLEIQTLKEQMQGMYSADEMHELVEEFEKKETDLRSRIAELEALLESQPPSVSDYHELLQKYQQVCRRLSISIND